MKVNGKLLGALVVLAFGMLSAKANAAIDPRQYQISRIVIKEIQDVQHNKFMSDKIDNFTEGCKPENTANTNPTPISGDDSSLNPVDAIDVIIDKIINIGKKIWAIVDAGKPVVNVKVDTANALPAGVHCWDELENWQAPTSKLYQVTYENGFGSSVVTYAFRVSFISGGTYHGQGKYITLATVQPANIEVAWGFKFDAVATVPMVFNQGTKTDPLAGMQLAMNWQVHSPLQEIQRAENFFVNGQGVLQKLK